MITDNESIRLIFGLKIRNLRQQKGLSYQQVSDLTKITVSYLHDIENGKKYPKADKILALGKALGTDYNYLVSLTGDKRVQPLIDLIRSDFINVIPWEHFGLSPASLLEIFTNTPDKVTAFVSTLVKISRAFQLTQENFYFIALQSYQDIHYNYFEDLEVAATTLRKEHNLAKKIPITSDILEKILQDVYNIHIDQTTMGQNADLERLRSYYAEDKKTLYINTHLTPVQTTFILAREIGFHYLQMSPRPKETIVLQPDSFDLLLNNFRASYFAAALFIPEGMFIEDIKRIAGNTKWDGSLWIELLSKYRITTEMLMQRLTNVLPHHFGIDQLFFLRMYGSDKNGFEISKELHLSQLHNPHANMINEHYCRRWMAISSIQQLQALPEKRKYKDLLIDVKISHYWQTQNRYLCITIAKPPIDKKAENSGSVTIGLLLDSKLARLMKFVNDESIVTRIVHTTCERCSISDCQERVAPPTFILKQQREERIRKALDNLEV